MLPYTSGNFPTIKSDAAVGKFINQELANIQTALSELVAVESLWTSYTPVVTSGTGAFTTVSAVGSYKAVGKTVLFQIEVTITTNGTAATNVQVTLPVSAIANHFVTAGRLNAGVALFGDIAGAAAPTVVTLLKYDNTYPGANGAVLTVSGSYESV